MNRSTTGLLIMYMMMVIPLFACATTHQISNGSTNQCMNVVNHGYPVPGTPVHVKQCDPWQNQQWAFNNGTSSAWADFVSTCRAAPRPRVRLSCTSPVMVVRVRTGANPMARSRASVGCASTCKVVLPTTRHL